MINISFEEHVRRIKLRETKVWCYNGSPDVIIYNNNDGICYKTGMDLGVVTSLMSVNQ